MIIYHKQDLTFNWSKFPNNKRKGKIIVNKLLSLSERSLDKEIIVENDEELLRKVVDEKLHTEEDIEELKRKEELAAQEALKKARTKKNQVLVTNYYQKEEPFF